MGFWGTGLYQNDCGSDVRDSYMELLLDQVPDQEAYQKILEEYSECIGDMDEPLFWYALADTQWRVGRLEPEVKEQALRWIEAKGGLDLWEEDGRKAQSWEKVLDKLKQKLESPMPKRKRVQRPKPFDHNYWNINDVYAYQFNGKRAEQGGYSGKYILLQKIGEGIDDFNGELSPRLQVLDRIFDGLPTLDDMEGLRILPLDFPHRPYFHRDPIWMSAIFSADTKRDYPAKYLTYLGNRPGPANCMESKQQLSWAHLELIEQFFRMWQGVEYETVGDGIYHYMSPESLREQQKEST